MDARDEILCPSCGHNLRGLHSTVCPECGQRFFIARQPVVVRQDDALVALTSSMRCPDCGYNNPGFMPRGCRRCGRRFTWWQRLFGIREAV